MAVDFAGRTGYAYGMFGKAVRGRKTAAVAGSVLSGLLLAAASLLWYVRAHPPNPVPPAIRSQLTFPVLYPRLGEADASAWAYDVAAQTLTFAVRYQGKRMVFTEQPVPLTYRDDQAAYDRFIGSLKPFANFRVPLGDVSMVNFVTEVSYKPAGKSALLRTNETLLVAHPDEEYSEQAWQVLLGSLHSYR